MARKKSSERKIQQVPPKSLREQIEKINETAKRTGTAPHLPFDAVDEAIEDHVFMLASRIRAIKELPRTDISTVEGAKQAIPILEEKLAEITQIKHTAERLKQLLSDE